jgi:hypothetical protein
MHKMIKCPCCLSDLKVTHQDKYETLIEHVEEREPSMKDGYQCLNSKCKAYEMNGVWIESGDFWIKEPPAGMNYEEAEEEVERHSMTGRVPAINSWQDGYEIYRADQQRRKITFNLWLFIFEWIPRYKKIEGINSWKRTDEWKRTIMMRREGRYIHFMTFWDIYYFLLDEYKNSIQGALQGKKEGIESIRMMANNVDFFGKKDNRFWWTIARYFICWVWNRKMTKMIIGGNI